MTTSIAALLSDLASGLGFGVVTVGTDPLAETHSP